MEINQSTQGVGRDLSGSKLISASIIIGSLIIAGATITGGAGTGNGSANVAGGPTPTLPGVNNDIVVAAVGDEDHIKGDPDAPITIIEYSDFECPFCKRVHPTLERVVQEYNGDVRWVYRHFPLAQLHSKAAKQAEATECATELGGNEGFWALTDKIFEVTPSNDGLDMDSLPALAAEVGLSKAAFTKCLDSGKYADKIAEAVQEAQAAGGQGTPYSIIMDKDGNTTPLSGALPYENWVQVIDELL